MPFLCGVTPASPTPVIMTNSARHMVASFVFLENWGTFRASVYLCAPADPSIHFVFTLFPPVRFLLAKAAVRDFTFWTWNRFFLNHLENSFTINSWTEKKFAPTLRHLSIGLKFEIFFPNRIADKFDQFRILRLDFTSLAGAPDHMMLVLIFYQGPKCLA